MRCIRLLALAFPVAVAAAQTPETCDVKRVNEPYYYVTQDRHPGTDRPYNHPVYQPPGYWSNSTTDPGVPAGYRTWRWVPSAVDMRREARMISGFCVYVRPSAATANYPTTGYIPQWQLLPVRPRSGGGFDPDTSQSALLTVPEGSLTFVHPDATRIRSAFSAAVPILAEEVCYALQWRGGEHRFEPGAQGFVGTTDEQPWLVPTWGQIDPTGAVSVTDPVQRVGEYTTLWFTHYETAPSIIPESDFAHLRRHGSPLPYSGFCDGAGLADLGTNPVDLGWNVDCGTGRGRAWVVPLVNSARQIFPGTSRLLGQTLEIDINDPLLGMLIVGGYTGRADLVGFYDGARVPFPAFGSQVIGLYLGVEFLVIDSGLSAVLGSTQAHWVQVIR